MLIYLHGFKSSPGSQKARQLGDYARTRNIPFACPALPVSPAAAIAVVDRLIADSPEPPTLVGSSMGGFFATWLAERHGLRAVLVNPLVIGGQNLEIAVGTHRNYHTGEVFEFTAGHVAELRAHAVGGIARPERYWVLLETGDEVLDYRQAVAFYAGARQTVLPGGDHSFTRWSEYLDAIAAFAA